MALIFLLVSLLLPLAFPVHAWVVSKPEKSHVNLCASLQHSKCHGVDIANTTFVPKGSLNVTNVFNAFDFCRLYASVPYGANSTLNFEVWLPGRHNYRGSYMAVGNGGMAGVIDTSAMMLQLNSGFAVAGGDSGHLASLNNDGSGKPGVYLPYLHNKDEVLAWIRNSIAMFTAPAKQLVEEFYGSPARHNYYAGCSTGGAQGFALAQYHPNVFDGIIAGCPGNWSSHLALSFLWNGQAAGTNASFVPQELLTLIKTAVLAKCDAIDGVVDGLVEDPLKCDFDIDTLACGEGVLNTTGCLTAAQLATVKAIYDGPRDSRTGKSLYPGFNHGSKSEWMFQENVLADAFSIPILQNLVFDNLTYDSSTFNWGSDVDTLDANAGSLIDAISPDLSAFESHGGKMLVFQGWADPYNAATWPMDHLQQIEEVLGEGVADFFSLFMIPGGGHCGAASTYPSVPKTYATVDAMVNWVERLQKPEQILASNPPDGSQRTRKLCPWPETAHLTGLDVNSWDSYTCQ